ncbi:hypothetical protein [Oceanicella actignis]|uniref:hypothetical protein n=1 Tax=Oceanicella actignis TaxID=1189325 RepID=UPI0011E65685|nr:hypothetical protein [Oceanicella actignis]
MSEETGTDESPTAGRLNAVRRFVPVALGLGLFALGVYALHRLLKPVKAADVIAQVRATP